MSLCYISHSLLISSLAFADPKQTRPQTSISALTSSWDWKHLELTLQGEVELKRGELSLRCEQTTIKFRNRVSKSKDQQGDLQTLEGFSSSWDSQNIELVMIEAKGNVRFDYRSLKMRADEIRYQHNDRSIHAAGQVNGRWGSSLLQGRDLFLRLDQSIVTIKKLNLTLAEDRFVHSVKKLFDR